MKKMYRWAIWLVAGFLLTGGGIYGQQADWQYLAVGPDGWADALAPLLAARGAAGLTVHFEPLASALAGQPGTDDAARLRAFLLQAYQAHGTRYLLLAGDASVLPVRRCTFTGELAGQTVTGNPATDWYFADLDGVWDLNGDGICGDFGDRAGLAPELAAGRIPAADAAGAAALAGRILALEQAPPAPFRALLAVEETWPALVGPRELQRVQAVLPAGPAEVLDGRTDIWQGNDLLDRLQSGTAIWVNHSGYGSLHQALRMTAAALAARPVISPALVYSNADRAGDFSVPGSFGACLTTGGSNVTAAFMYTGEAFAALPQGQSPAGQWNRMLLEELFRTGSRHPGDALRECRRRMLSRAEEPLLLASGLALNLLGDPAQKLPWECVSPRPILWPLDLEEGFRLQGGEPVPLAVSLRDSCTGLPLAAAVTMQPGSGQVLALHDDGLSPDSCPGDGIYTGLWEPVPEDPVLLQFSAQLPGPEPPLTFPLTGRILPPVTYRAAPVPFRWELLPPDTAPLDSCPGDDRAWQLSIGFPFSFYGLPCTTVWVSSNGSLLFEGAPLNDRYPGNLPSPALPDALAACFWTGLQAGPRSDLRAAVLGTSPCRRLVVEWRDFLCGRYYGTVTFQAVLEEDGNRIRFNYQDTDCGDPLYDAGAAAVSGLEGPDGRHGIEYSAFSAGLPSRHSVEFTPEQPDGTLLLQAVWGSPARPLHIVPGDRAPARIQIGNAGGQTMHDTTIQAAGRDGVLAEPATPVALGTLAPGQESTTVFLLTIPAALPPAGGATLNVQLGWTDDGGTSRTYNRLIVLPLGMPVPVQTRFDFEADAQGWQADTGWERLTGDAASGSGYFHAAGGSGTGSLVLESPPLIMPHEARLTFEQRYSLEWWYDGAVFEFDDGISRYDIQDLLETAAYPERLDRFCGNPLAGRPAWTGECLSWQPAELSMGSLAGRTVRIRLTLGFDESVESSGWDVDNFLLTGTEWLCPDPAGDVDGNGCVNSLDLVICLNALTVPLPSFQEPFWLPGRADLDHSLVFDAADLILLARRLAGM